MTESASEGVTGLATAALQSESLVSDLPTAAAQVFGLSLVAGGLAAVVAVAYRWYVNERVPSGLPILVGLSGVALYLGTSRALSQVIGNTGDPLDATAALANIVTFLVALAAARAGMDVGDRVGVDVFVAAGATEVESEVSRVVQAVGRVITVELPDEIDDIVGYDPVPDETKSKLGGKTFVFPRRLTVAELRDRLVTRLKADYAVGHVDIELGADGTVDFLALGARAAGIGPTLPPETSAVAVRADPAFAASAGDLVQVWRRDPFERVLTAEVRATSDDVVTLAVDAADTRKLDDGERYKLVTLPVETRPDREFVSLLRAAEETMAAVTVGERSALDGQPAGALDVSVVEPLPTNRSQFFDAAEYRLDVGRFECGVGSVERVTERRDALERGVLDADLCAVDGRGQLLVALARRRPVAIRDRFDQVGPRGFHDSGRIFDLLEEVDGLLDESETVLRRTA